MTVFGSLLLTDAIPTVVELEKDQYTEFLQLISDISIDIDSENLTINADLQRLEDLQSDTLLEIRSQKLILDADITATNTALQDQTTAVGRALSELRESNANGSLMLNKTLTQGFGMLNATLTELRKLESEEVNAIANVFYSKLDNINRVLGTINAFADTISTVLGVVDTFLTTTQSGLLTSQVTQQTTTNTLLQEFITVFPAKARAAVAETLWEVTSIDMDVSDILFDGCVYSPLGVGPIDCAGVETTELVLNGVKMIATASAPPGAEEAAVEPYSPPQNRGPKTNQASDE